MTERTRCLSRRNFLLTVGAAVAAPPAKSSGSNSQGKDKKRATRGYQASEHVSNYYRTTKV